MVFPRTTVAPETFPAWRALRAPCRGVVFLDLDLRPFDAELSDRPQPRDPSEACVFLGCRLGPMMADIAAVTQALVMPRIPGAGVDAFRSDLYTVDELYEGFSPGGPAGYRATRDWRVYTSYMRVDAEGHPATPPQRVPVGVEVTLARRLHDGSISDALHAFLASFQPPAGPGVVAFMGGHDTPRDAPEFRAVAEAARALAARGLLVATGGGPGLMEAANLGAWASAYPDPVLDDALAGLAAAPTFRDPGWADAAWSVRGRHPRAEGAGVSLGVPTWFYGHEPPNMFASHIAKYFENSLREEGLLAIATHGVIFAPGRAGTVQEVFQDACQNFYAVYGVRSPMVLLGSRYWTDAGGDGYPAAPLLAKLASDGGFAERVHVTDDPDEAVEIIAAFSPA